MNSLRIVLSLISVSWLLVAGALADERETDSVAGGRRLLLLLPAGPLVVDVTATIDGRPFDAERERLIGRMLDSSDADGDGRVTWAEALDNPRFGAGWFVRISEDEHARRRAMARFDENRNGLVERREARRVAAVVAGGEAFAASHSFSDRHQRTPSLARLLDTNGDGDLSPREMDQAATRLHSRDVNDNEILDPAELALLSPAARGTPSGDRREMAVRAFLIGDAVNWPGVTSELIRRYGRDGQLFRESFLAPKNLFTSLDAGRDGVLSVEDVSRLRTLPPHLQLEVHLGDVGKRAAGVRLTSVATDLQPRAEVSVKADGTIRLSLPAARLEIKSRNLAPWYDYQRQTKSRFARFDRNGDGVLQAGEMYPDPRRGGARLQFRRWDLNKDGKVTRAEMSESLELSQRLPFSGAAAAVVDGGSHLFATLDGNGDGRLSAREVYHAPRRLKPLDVTGDGRVGRQEIPRNVRLILDRAAYDLTDSAETEKTVGKARLAGKTVIRDTWPEWFQRMDRNGDGDVSRREFLGAPSHFGKFDRNNDGFIEPGEAGK